MFRRYQANINICKKAGIKQFGQEFSFYKESYND
jgi:hypothetical protein